MLTGNDILNMGIINGPLIGSILEALRDARLQGLIGSKQEEIDFVTKNYIN
tara:strand:- start:174 stop:326 length:153 start_codon:yes stop_codon:yes gene_type:complete